MQGTFVLRAKPEALESCDRLEIAYNEQQLEAEGEADTAGLVVFYLKPLLGKDNRHISNLMARMDRKGSGQWMTGDVARERVVRSVWQVGDQDGANGLTTEDGKAVERLDYSTYALLPGFMVTKLLERINIINGEDDTGEEELGE